MRLRLHLSILVSLSLFFTAALPLSAQQLVNTIRGGEKGQYFGSIVAPLGGSEDAPTSLMITGILSNKLQISPIMGTEPPSTIDLSMIPNNSFSRPVAASAVGGSIHFLLLHGNGRLAHLVSGFNFFITHEINLDRGTVCRDASLVGDVNFDGAVDFAIGCPTRFSSAAQMPIELGGAVYVYSGFDKSPLLTLSGKPTENFGTAVSAAGDVNADGYADIVVGVVPSSTTGRAEVYSGRTGSLLYTFRSPANTLDFGMYVAGVRDTDRDGFDDIAVGAPTESRDNKVRNLVRVFSGRNGSELHTFKHNDSKSFFGIVNAAGDFNSDGAADIIVGAPRYGDNSGRAFIYSGLSGRILASLSLGLNRASQNLFGNQVGIAGKGMVYVGIPRNVLNDAPGIVNIYAYDPSCSNQLRNDPLVIQCGCGNPDIADDDNDSVVNCLDDCPLDTTKSKVGGCGCGVPDTDSDSDGVPDCNDTCTNSSKGAPGVCGCAVPDTDSDADGLPDCLDECPHDNSKVSPGVCGCRDPGVPVPPEGIECPGDAAIELIKLTKPKTKKLKRSVKNVRITMMDLSGRPGNWHYKLIVRRGQRLVKQVTTRSHVVTMRLKSTSYTTYYYIEDGSNRSANSPTKKFNLD